ncbi:MAG: hypothetical protein HOO97_07550 [Sideroxydans sp.]|nr:hypothetical protein [Sideroxydans sp.]
MINKLNHNKSQLTLGIAACLLSTLLVSCGGSAGSSNKTTPPARDNITVTCPNGSNQTTTTQAAAEAACPAPALTAVIPAHGSSNLSPASFTDIAVTTDSILNAASLTTANITLGQQGIPCCAPVAGTVSAVGSKGFKFTPSTTLTYGSTYHFVANVKDSLGKTLTLNSSFTTVALACVSPQIAYGGACVTPVTVTCPNGTFQTAATMDLANAQCPAPVLINGNSGVGLPINPVNWGGVLVETDSFLDPAGVLAGMSLNGVSVPGAVVMQAGGKGFVFTPTFQLEYSKTYQFTAVAKDVLGKSLTVNGTYTTIAPPPTCTFPDMLNSNNVCMSPPAPTGYTWNSVLRAWVADVGTLVVGANVLPNTCVLVGDTCWNDSIANGTIKLVNSGVVMTGVNTRPILFAYFQIGNNGTASAGNYNTRYIYGDAQALSPFNQQILDGSSANLTIEVKGTNVGIKSNIPPFGCYEFVWKSTFFGMNTSTCPL